MGRAAPLMTHTVTLAAASSVSNFSDVTYAAQTTIKARVEHRRTLAIDASGNRVSAEHTVISESEIKLSDRVWLPGDDTSEANEARRPISVGNADIPGSGYTLYEAKF